MLLEYLKNSLNTWGNPTQFKRTYDLLPDGRHSVKWTGAAGNKGQQIYIDTEPNGNTIKCFICGVPCLTAAVKYQRKNNQHKRHTCTRKCQNKLTQSYEWNPRMIPRDDDGWYIETCKGPTNGYIMKRFRPTKGKHRIKIFQHRWVMEQHLGRKLTKYEHIHHIDIVKTNNNIDNLWLCTPSQHAKAHRSLERLLPKLMKQARMIKFNKKTGIYYLKEII